jgi:hypothetical protein
MKLSEKFFNWLARVMSIPRIRDAIIAYAQQYPYSHIPPVGDVGSYMERYHILPEVWWSPIAIRLHIIRSADTDRALHNHPFSFRTFIINGGYWERRDEPQEAGIFDGSLKYWGTGTSYSLDKSELHCVELLGRATPGPVVTVFVHRKRADGSDWGFKDPVTAKIVSHDQFIDRSFH